MKKTCQKIVECIRNKEIWNLTSPATQQSVIVDNHLHPISCESSWLRLLTCLFFSFLSNGYSLGFSHIPSTWSGAKRIVHLHVLLITFQASQRPNLIPLFRTFDGAGLVEVVTCTIWIPRWTPSERMVRFRGNEALCNGSLVHLATMSSDSLVFWVYLYVFWMTDWSSTINIHWRASSLICKNKNICKYNYCDCLVWKTSDLLDATVSKSIVDQFVNSAGAAHQFNRSGCDNRVVHGFAWSIELLLGHLLQINPQKLQHFSFLASLCLCKGLSRCWSKFTEVRLQGICRSSNKVKINILMKTEIGNYVLSELIY